MTAIKGWRMLQRVGVSFLSTRAFRCLPYFVTRFSIKKGGLLLTNMTHCFQCVESADRCPV